MPWEYWAISNGALLLLKSRRFTLRERLFSNMTDAEFEQREYSFAEEYYENGY
jgi:hypothetical protein